MKTLNPISMNDDIGKLIFSVACGWIYGLVSYAHVLQTIGENIGIHIWNFPGFSHINDAVQYVISLIKAASFGGASYVGATALAKLVKWWKKKHKKHDHEQL